MASQIWTLRVPEAPRRVVKAASPALVARVKRKAALPEAARGKLAANRDKPKREPAVRQAKLAWVDPGPSPAPDETDPDTGGGGGAAAPSSRPLAAGTLAAGGEDEGLAPPGPDQAQDRRHSSLAAGGNDDDPALSTSAVGTPDAEDAPRSPRAGQGWATPASQEGDDEEVVALKAHIDLLLQEVRVCCW